MSFTNLYYKRTAGTAKACYICCKPTTTVLATLNTTDYLYTCPVHLGDRGFATLVEEAGDGAQGTRKPGVSSEEVVKVKEEWEEIQKKKEDKGKGEDKEKNSEKAKDKEKSSEKAKETEKSSEKAKETEREQSEADKKVSKHERYTLHRDYFASSVLCHYWDCKTFIHEIDSAVRRAPEATTGSTSEGTGTSTASRAK